MKNNIFHIVALTAAVVTAFTLTSCTLETSDNGKLDGYWHLEQVDTLATGGVCDLSDHLVFWAVQAKMLALMDRGDFNNVSGYILRFSHEGGRLRLYNPYLNDRLNGDVRVDNPAVLAPFGVNALEEDFLVEQLSGSKMRLSNRQLRLHFRKF